MLSKFESNTDGVLIDVRMSKDGKLVLHENDLIFNDNYISRMNYQDIKKIKIGETLKNYYIPLLEEILLYYDKDLLIIRLHHNYDENEKLVKELKSILGKYYVKKLIIVTDNDNLYEYLKILTDYEVYSLKNSNNFSLTTFILSKQHNNKIVSDIYSNNKSDLEVFSNLSKYDDNLNNIYVITNNPKILKIFYL